MRDIDKVLRTAASLTVGDHVRESRKYGKWMDDPFAYYSKADPETYVVHSLWRLN